MWPLRTAVDKKEKSGTQVSVTVIKTKGKERKGSCCWERQKGRFLLYCFFISFSKECTVVQASPSTVAAVLHGKVLRCRSVQLGCARSVVVCSRGFFSFHDSYCWRLLVSLSDNKKGARDGRARPGWHPTAGGER